MNIQEFLGLPPEEVKNKLDALTEEQREKIIDATNNHMKEWENSRPHKSHDEKQRDRQIMDKPFERVR